MTFTYGKASQQGEREGLQFDGFGNWDRMIGGVHGQQRLGEVHRRKLNWVKAEREKDMLSGAKVEAEALDKKDQEIRCK